MTAPAVNWTDPCQRADASREAFYGLLAGEKAVSTSYLANGVSREVRFGQADLAALERELRLARAALRRRRHRAEAHQHVLLQHSKGL